MPCTPSLHSRRMISAAGDRAVESSTSDDDLPALILDSSEQDSSEEDAPTSGERGCVRCSLVKPEFFATLTNDEFFRARGEMDEMAAAFLPLRLEPQSRGSLHVHTAVVAELHGNVNHSSVKVVTPVDAYTYLAKCLAKGQPGAEV